MGTKPLLDAGIFLVKIWGLNMGPFQESIWSHILQNGSFPNIKREIDCTILLVFAHWISYLTSHVPS